MPKRIKIIDCSDPMFWYAEYLGTDKEFAVIKEERDRYWTREDAGYLNFVLKKDAEEV